MSTTISSELAPAVREALDKVASLDAEQYERFKQELLRLEDDETDIMSDAWLSKMNERMEQAKSGQTLSSSEVKERFRQHRANR